MKRDPDKAKAWRQRSKPLTSNPERTAAWQARTRRPLPARSARRSSEAQERADVRALVIARDGGCVARDVVPEVPCGSPFRDRPALEVDEVVSRGVRPGGHLDPANCQALCQLHHDWRTANPAEARRRGLRRESWEATP